MANENYEEDYFDEEEYIEDLEYVQAPTLSELRKKILKKLDDGGTIENLFLSGVDVLRSQKRKDYIQKVANNFGIKITSEEEIVTESNGADFARKMNNFMSAISSISDMSRLSNDK